MHLKHEMKLLEEVRDWILAISMDQKVDRTLPQDDRNLYESCLGMSDVACLISGYPVIGRQPITFQRSPLLANRDSWSELTVVAKMSPHTDVPEVNEFLEKWHGPANYINIYIIIFLLTTISLSIKTSFVWRSYKFKNFEFESEKGMIKIRFSKEIFSLDF
jgi:hypothetical protein